MAARKLDLRTGRPVWFSYRVPKTPFSPLDRDIRTDVLVVGAGISGAMVAEALSGEGLGVTLVDRRHPIAGSTAATTALVQYEIDQPLSLLSRRIGREPAERAWRRSRLAIASLEALIETLGIDCLMERRGSLYLAGNVLDAEGLAGEMKARRRAGLAVDLVKSAALRERFGIRRRAALLGQGNLALDPRRLTAGLLAVALARKARIHAPSEAISFEHSAGEVLVATKEGPLIRAGHVVLATGYELASIVPRDGHKVISTYAIATAPQERGLKPAMPLVWEASDPYLYLRTTHDGRIICGGEDEQFQDEEARDALIAQKSLTLSAQLGKLLPGIDTRPQFAWAGAVGAPPPRRPRIGPRPRRPRHPPLLGCGGTGRTG